MLRGQREPVKTNREGDSNKNQESSWEEEHSGANVSRQGRVTHTLYSTSPETLPREGRAARFSENVLHQECVAGIGQGKKKNEM